MNNPASISRNSLPIHTTAGQHPHVFATRRHNMADSPPTAIFKHITPSAPGTYCLALAFATWPTRPRSPIAIPLEANVALVSQHYRAATSLGLNGPLYCKNRTGYYIAADPIGSAVIDHNALRRPFHLPLLHGLTPSSEFNATSSTAATIIILHFSKGHYPPLQSIS